MRDSVDVTLPGGRWLGGSCRREIRIRALTGADEAVLLEEDSTLAPAHWVTSLLDRCIEPTDDHASTRDLTVGDREALVLQVRRLTLGDQMACTIACPFCGELLDLELRSSDLLVAPYLESGAHYELSWKDGQHTFRATFRLPTGGDQEAVVNLAREDVDVAANALLERCLEDATMDGVLVEALPPSVAERVDASMAELDSQAEVLLNLRCPDCNSEFSTLFDTGAYFRRELAAHAAELYQDVHTLALHYHWSEAEIMSMTARKRARYLGLLRNALSTERGDA